MTTALVMAGGGSKGSFQVGALQYLYDNDFFAEIICSTSVGSVNALMLAHGGDQTTQRQAFATLKSVWETKLTHNTDMYTEGAWAATVSPGVRKELVDLFNGKVPWLSIAAAFLGPLIPVPIPGFPFGPVGVSPIAIGQLISIGKPLVDLIGQVKSNNPPIQALFDLTPTRGHIKANLDETQVAASGVRLRLVTVSLDSGRIRYVTETGAVIERDGTPVKGPDPTVCKTELDDYEDAVNELRTFSRDQPKPKDAAGRAKRDQELKAKQDAVTQAKAALDACMAVNLANGTAKQLRVSVLDGAMASAAIPCVFPPVELGSETYVDGGIRWQTPVQTALDLGADTIVAINTSVYGEQWAGSFATANLVDIAYRAVFGLELWETQEGHYRAAHRQVNDEAKQLWMVNPRVEVHDIIDVDPGLIDINIAYGYMCTADVMTAFKFPPPPPQNVVTIPSATTQDIAGQPRSPHATPPPHTSGGSSTTAGPSTHGIQSHSGRVTQLVAAPSSTTSPPTPTPKPTALWVDAATDSVQAALADAIAVCRRLCWELEHQVMGRTVGETIIVDLKPGPPPLVNPFALYDVRNLKQLLHQLVQARTSAGGIMPPNPQNWADNWERHSWDVTTVHGLPPSPWGSYSTTAPPAAATLTVAAEALATNGAVFSVGDTDVWFVDDQRHLLATTSIPMFLTGTAARPRTAPKALLYAIPRGGDL
jgi:predicted acylesterase/phospholipase RssA